MNNGLVCLLLGMFFVIDGAKAQQTNWNQINQQNFAHQQRMESQFRQAAMNEQAYLHHQQQSNQYWEKYWANQAAAQQAYNEARIQALSHDDFSRTADWWGAIGVHMQTGAWSWNAGHSNGRAAYTQIMEDCPKGNCALLAMYSNTCVAAAHDVDGAVFWADNVKRKVAVESAMAECRKNSAASQTCIAPKDFVACSGYAYQDFRGKLSRFNRGGLIAMIAPKSAGIPDLAPGKVMYNPAVTQLTAQPPALRDSAAVVAAQAIAEGKPGALWGAVALSRMGGLGLGMGLTESMAKADAVKKCSVEGCEVVVSYEGDTCLAFGTGQSPGGKPFIVVNAFNDKARVEAITLEECKDNGGINCKIDNTNCFDLTP